MSNHHSPRKSALSRTRNLLLASALSAGMVGVLASGTLIDQYAFADAVRVEAPAPADFTAVVAAVQPAVVSVRVKTNVAQVATRQFSFGQGFPDLPDDHPFNEFFKRFGMPRDFGQGPGDRSPPRRDGMAQGSGFFISEDGYLVTNHHVIDKADEITVVMDDGRELDAKLVGSDERTDLALLKVDGTDFTYVEFSDQLPAVGQWVVAVGNPFGLGGSVTAGIVSAHGRDIGSGPYDDFLQIDAPVNRGNSGGPTFNTKGEVVGVNTAIFSPSGGNIGIAFAIPASTAKQVIESLKDNGSVTRGWLGVQIQSVTADIADSLGIKSTDGALVSDPQDGGPALKAGIRAGDIIAKVDDQKVDGPRELARVIAGYQPGSKVALTVLRDGSERVIDVTLGKLENQASLSTDENGESNVEPTTLSQLGLIVAPADDGQGVVVTDVDSNSAAAERGITAGEEIVAVNGNPVDSAEAVIAEVGAAKDKGRGAVLLQVKGERGTRFVALPVDKG